MALYTIRSGVTNHPEKTFLQLYSDLVTAGGVVDVSADHYKVIEASGGGLNVDVSVGNGYVKNATSSAYPIYSTTVETVAIDSNASGNPRIDAIVAYVDLSVVPVYDDEATDVHLLASVEGTPSASPSAPTDSAIQSAIGSANPWIRLANVTVANGATGISTANISDQRRRVYFKSYSPLVTISYTASFTPDYSISNQQLMTLTGDVTVNAPSNMHAGDWLVIRFLQDGTGGRSLTLGANLQAKSPDMTTATGASQTTSIAIHKISDTAHDTYLLGKNY